MQHSAVLPVALATAVLAATPLVCHSASLCPNEKSGTISVIDTDSDTVVAEFKASSKLRGLTERGVSL